MCFQAAQAPCHGAECLHQSWCCTAAMRRRNVASSLRNIAGLYVMEEVCDLPKQHTTEAVRRLNFKTGFKA